MQVDENNKYIYSSNNSSYIQEVELLEGNILSITVSGNADFEAYTEGIKMLQEIVDKESVNSKLFLFHDYKNILEIPSKTRIYYKDWVLSNIDKFELVFFSGLEKVPQAIIKTGKVFFRKYDKIFIVDSFEKALWKINFNKLASECNKKNKGQLSSLLENIPVCNKDSWNGSIDNGRLLYETYLIDKNIFVRKLSGELVKGDMDILVSAFKEIKLNILNNNEKYFFYLDLKNLKIASLSSRKEATEWFLGLMSEIENAVFFNLNPTINLIVKFSMSLSRTFQKKVFIKDDLYDAMCFVFHQKKITHKKRISLKERLINIFTINSRSKISSLQKEVAELKNSQTERLDQLFTILGNVSWNEVQEVQDFDLPNNDAFSEIFAAVKLLQYDVNNIIEKRDGLINEARKSEKLTSAFLANMSHEIRTPLNGIIGFAEIIAEADLDETNKRYLKIIQQNSDTLLNIINDIIDISKFEAKQISIIEKSFNLHSLLYSVYETFSKLIKNQDVELKLFFPSDNDRIIYSDEHRIKQILTNLLGNSNKFTSKGEISFGYDIVFENNIKYIKFFVKDTGIGISEEDSTKIFERFTQVDAKLARKYAGSGLGLSISKNIVDLFSGEIWLDSEINIGTTFYFTIPFKEADLSSAKTVELDKIDIENKKIFIIEDDENNFIYLRELLSTNEENIYRAKDGVEAIKIINENNFDLIFLDINLPKMNGWEIFKEIKKIKPNSKIIAQTANAFKEDIDKAKELGFNGYLTKPFNRKELFDEINKVLK